MKKSQKQAVAMGAGVAAIAAAAAGVYMLTGKNAKNRKKVSKWVSDMQNDVVRELDKAGNASKATYNKVVDSVAKNYKNLKTVNAPELALVAAELKGGWDKISSELSAASNAVRRVAPKRTVKKTPAKKTAAKKTPAKKAAKKASKRR